MDAIMEYPSEIVSFVRKKTLCIDAFFTQEKNESPLKIFDKNFSRFVCTVMSDSTRAFFNLPIEALPGMRAKSDIVAKIQFTPNFDMPSISQSQEEQVDTSSIAFTTKFVAGDLKGKSPADVLFEDPVGGGQKLNTQYKFLKQNLQKYPNNQKLMDAIQEASKLDLSKCKASGLASASVNIPILEIGCRPLIRKTRASDGKCQVYEASIIYTKGTDYPIHVSIDNYYANYVKNENGTLNVKVSSKDCETEVKKGFDLTVEEWLYAMYCMENTRDNFRLIHFSEAHKLAVSGAEYHRKNVMRTEGGCR